MAKSELGRKWTCENCESKFFDLNRDPIICPRCATLLYPPVLAVRAPSAGWQSKRATIESPVAPTDESGAVDDPDSNNDQVESDFDNPDDLTR